MDGVTVLNIYADDYGYFAFGIILCIILFLLSVTLLGIAVELTSCSCAAIGIIILILFFSAMVYYIDVTDRLNVLVDDSVSFNEFMENYDVVGHKGIIWTVTPKDKNE